MLNSGPLVSAFCVCTDIGCIYNFAALTWSQISSILCDTYIYRPEAVRLKFERGLFVSGNQVHWISHSHY